MTLKFIKFLVAGIVVQSFAMHQVHNEVRINDLIFRNITILKTKEIDYINAYVNLSNNPQDSTRVLIIDDRITKKVEVRLGLSSISQSDIAHSLHSISILQLYATLSVHAEEKMYVNNEQEANELGLYREQQKAPN